MIEQVGSSDLNSIVNIWLGQFNFRNSLSIIRGKAYELLIEYTIVESYTAAKMRSSPTPRLLLYEISGLRPLAIHLYITFVITSKFDFISERGKIELDPLSVIQIGEVPERLNGTDSKSVLRLRTVTGVRIPPSPQEAISKEVKSTQIVDLQALFILLPRQITPSKSKFQ